MKDLIKNTTFKDECQQSSQKFINVIFEKCSFENLILSDLKFENVDFLYCKFDHIFVESFTAKRVSFSNSEIESLSLRNHRKITSKKISWGRDHNVMEEVNFKNSSIKELVLGGNLNIINCAFPKGENYLHIKKPFQVYNECIDFVKEFWEGEKKRIGLIELGNYVSKGVEKQAEDFVVYSHNSFLENEVNKILFDVFQLLKHKADQTGASL